MNDGYNIPAKEVIYNGQKYRSTLEARWAMFFDLAHIKFVYELQTFYCGTYDDCSDVFYEPDFYLPEYDIYCEVKATETQLAHSFINKIQYAIDFNQTDISRKGLLILGQIPKYNYSIPVFKYLYCYKGICAGNALFDVWRGEGCLYRSIMYRRWTAYGSRETDYYGISGAESYALEDTELMLDGYGYNDVEKVAQIFKENHFIEPDEWDGEGATCSDPKYVNTLFLECANHRFH